MFMSYRLEDPNLSTFGIFQKKQIKSFQNFIMKKPDGFCSVCMVVLYPEEQHYRTFSNLDNIPCISWNLQPLVSSSNESERMVCKKHKKFDESKFPLMNYPGKLDFFSYSSKDN